MCSLELFLWRLFGSRSSDGGLYVISASEPSTAGDQRISQEPKFVMTLQLLGLLSVKPGALNVQPTVGFHFPFLECD